jgi:hypothetical protein
MGGLGGVSAGAKIIGKYGDDMASVAIKAGKLTNDASSIAKFKNAKILEINSGIIKQTQAFTTQFGIAAKANPSKLIGMGKTIKEQSAKLADELAVSIGDPQLAEPLRKAMDSKTTSIYKTAMKKGQRNLLGKTVDDVGKGGLKSVDEIPTNPVSKFANGTWAGKAGPFVKPALIIAGVGILFSESFLDLGSWIIKTLETVGFLPEGTTNGFISLWGKIRGFITVALFGALILGTFYIANIVFGAAKTAKSVVDSVTDNIVPDAKPSGA